MTDDRSVERDNKGRFIAASLSSDEARRMNEIATESKKGASKDELLRQAGYEPDDAPEHLVLLAKMAGGKGTGAVSALNAFIKLTVKPDRPVKDGNNCHYADSCVLFAAYEGRAQEADIEAARQRLEDRRNGT